MHHLILLRDRTRWSPVPLGEEDPGTRSRLGAVYRAVRRAFGEEVVVTVLDSRHGVLLLPLLVRDALRYRVPVLTMMRTVVSAGVPAGILDGQILFRSEIPEPEVVVEWIRGRLQVHRVGAAPGPEEGPP